MVRPGQQHRQRMPMGNKGNQKQGGHYSSNRPSASQVAMFFINAPPL